MTSSGLITRDLEKQTRIRFLMQMQAHLLPAVLSMVAQDITIMVTQYHQSIMMVLDFNSQLHRGLDFSTAFSSLPASSKLTWACLDPHRDNIERNIVRITNQITVRIPHTYKVIQAVLLRDMC
jgi:hypothetical protein